MGGGTHPGCNMDMDEGHTSTDGMSMGGDSMADSGMMSMTFHLGTNEVVLFKFWKVTDVGSMVYSCVIIFVLAILYEGLKYFREWISKNLKQKPKKSCGKNGIHCECRADSSEALASPLLNRRWRQQMISQLHLIQTLMHIIQFFVSYLLMLTFMTYNVWLCLAVTLGAGTGFFLFGWQKQKVNDITEHCH